MKKILIIEDDEAQLRLMAKALRMAGFNALEAVDGDVGKGLAQTHLPDLILCDVHLGETSGLAVLTALRSTALTSGIPVILMSGGHENRSTDRPEPRADNYLDKPFDHRTMVAAVQQILTSRPENIGRVRAGETTGVLPPGT